MLYSMTGFGRGECVKDGRRACAEIRSVNHRYLDLNLKIPSKLNIYEGKIRNLIKEVCFRGKVDVSVSFEDPGQSAANLELNLDLAKTYLDHFKTLENELGLVNDVTCATLARVPGVFVSDEKKEEDPLVWSVIENALSSALCAFKESKGAEGEALKADIDTKLEHMLETVGLIEERYPAILDEYREKLMAKLSEIKADTTVDESRLAAEMVIYADRLCTDEEIVRLRSHILAMRKALDEGGEAGRRLDFIAQEMNREANTILSKANDLRTSSHGISLKTDIEKVREQIQNLE